MAARLNRGGIWLLDRPRPDNLCNVFTVHQNDLRSFVGTVRPEKMREVCRALAIACACD